MDKNLYFMKKALKLAKISYKNNDVPVGAVVVLNNKIIGYGYNKKELKKDASSHAELMAMKMASKYLNSPYLLNCSLYTSLEPCLMCAGAIVNFRVSKVFIAAKNPRFGSLVSNLDLNSLNLNHKAELNFGILEKESSYLLSKFFRELRLSKKSKV